jgi:methyl coenzyme M reductase beta subunit
MTTMTIQQVVRDILERAIEDGLVCPAKEETRDEWQPRQSSAEDLAGCTNILAAWLRQRGTAATEQPEGDAASG